MQNLGQAGTIVTVRFRVENQLEPELATVRLAVGFDGHQRSPVLERCTQVAAKVRASLEALNTPEAAPLTRWSQSQTSVWSDRPWSADGQQLPLVYHARAEFSATFGDFGELGAWIAATSAREGLSIEGIEWALTDEHARDAAADAQVEAVREARTKAEHYAAALGLHVVSVLEIADAGLLGEATPLAEFAVAGRHLKASGDAGGLAFRPEPVIVTASVDARFLATT